MPNCPNCNSALEEFKGKLVCTNENCNFSIKKEEFKKLQRPWYKNLCADDSLWYKKVFDEYPSIIAHEYWRLYDLLENGQKYGAVWQLKDLFEVLLKFPTLIVASAIYAKRERSDAENKVLIALLSKALSLGDWEKIACHISDKCTSLSDFSQDLSPILENIVSLYNEHNITNWRNESIGHGALGFDADDEFKEDFQAKIELLKQHFETCDSVYSKLRFFLEENGKTIVLHGKDNARNLQNTSTNFFVETEHIRQPLFPYILFYDQSIYFFNYWICEKRTVLLNYPEGKKYDSIHPNPPNKEFSELYKALNKEKEIETIVTAEASVEEKTYSKRDEEMLEKLATIDDFEIPVYLEKWLKASLKKDSKGVFLLQMERGMGKTTFARGLDDQALRKFNLQQHFSIRAYYVDSSYLSKVGHFTSKLNFLLCSDKNGKTVIQGELPTLSEYSEHKKEDFANTLNFYKRAHQRHFNKPKLLFIIDGLDEIPAGDGVSIFDFIPTPDLLDDGVYLLLTCRTGSELSSYTVTHLKTLTLTNQVCFQKEDRKYLEVLESYIRHQMNRTTPTEITTLLGKAENRFLYLKMLKELLAVQVSPFVKGDQGGFSPGEFPEGKALFESFLDHLKSAYGEKFFAGVIRLLCILATAFESLTVQEISYLYGEEKMTFRLLAHLIDLRGFLNVERSYRGNLISLGHEELKELVKEKYAQTIQELVEEWIENSINLRTEDVNPENDGETYLLAYLLNYANQYLKRKEMQVSDSKKFSNTVAEVAFNLANTFLFEYHREREVMLCSELIEIGQWLLKQNQLGVKNNLAIALENRGMAYHNLHRLQEAMSDFNQAILMIEALLDTKELSDENILAHLLAHRGAVYDDLQYPQEAIADYNQAIEIQQRVLDSGKLLNEADLAGSLMNRGCVYHRIQKLQEAICDHSQAIKIWQEKSPSDKTLNDELNLAGAFMNRGSVYLHLPDLQKAIDDSNQAITIYQRLSDLGKLKDENELAKALMNRGTAYKGIQLYEEAIADYNQAIAIYQRLFETGKLRNKNEFAMTLSNRGIVYDELQISQEAIADYTQAIIILQQLMDEEYLLDESDLATVLLNRGVAYRCLGKLQEAITDYTQAILIQQRLLDAGILLNENDFATTLMNRALAYRKLHKFHEAISDYTQAITIQRKLLDSNELLNENDLVTSLINRGVVYWNLNRIEKVLDDARQAVNIMHSLLPEKPSLIGSYIKSVCFSVEVMKENERTEKLEELIHKLHETLNQYELTDEAQYWLDKISELLK